MTHVNNYDVQRICEDTKHIWAAAKIFYSTSFNFHAPLMMEKPHKQQFYYFHEAAESTKQLSNLSTG